MENRRLVRIDQAGEFAGEIPADPKVSALAVGDDSATASGEPAPPRAIVEAGKVAILDKGE